MKLVQCTITFGVFNYNNNNKIVFIMNNRTVHHILCACNGICVLFPQSASSAAHGVCRWLFLWQRSRCVFFFCKNTEFLLGFKNVHRGFRGSYHSSKVTILINECVNINDHWYCCIFKKNYIMFFFFVFVYRRLSNILFQSIL